MDTGLTAADVKQALRRRHPAYEPGVVGIGRWTCIEEWQNIDLLALDAWRSADVVGYEVKVSRSDMRTELLKPKKRRAAVAMCTRFFFAVPAGMLTEEERAFEQPADWGEADFKRQRCPGIPAFGPVNRYWSRRKGELLYGGQCQGTPRRRKVVQPYTVQVPVPITLPPRLPRGTAEETSLKVYLDRLERERQYELEKKGSVRVPCPACGGKGYALKSRVELEAPTLWVPPDVGLVVVNDSGCTVLKNAPRRKIPEPILPWPYVAGRSKRLDEENSARVQRQALNVLVRWVSARPDPRHLHSYSDTVDP